MSVKSFLEFLSITANVISVGAFVVQVVRNRNTTAMKRIVSNPYFKVLILSLGFTALVFLLPFLCPYFCPPCPLKTDSVTILKRDTITRWDTVKVTVYKDRPVPMKERATPPVMSQKIDSGGSGVQAGTISGGNVAGHDVIVNEPSYSAKELNELYLYATGLITKNHLNSNSVWINIAQGSNGNKIYTQIIDYFRSQGFTVNSSFVGGGPIIRRVKVELPQKPFDILEITVGTF
jgi:hypothetical protein